MSRYSKIRDEILSGKSDKNISYMKQLIEDIRTVFPEVPLFVMKLMPVAEQFVIIRKEQIAWTSEQVNHGENNCYGTFFRIVISDCQGDALSLLVHAENDKLSSFGFPGNVRRFNFHQCDGIIQLPLCYNFIHLLTPAFRRVQHGKFSSVLHYNKDFGLIQ